METVVRGEIQNLECPDHLSVLALSSARVSVERLELGDGDGEDVM